MALKATFVPYPAPAFTNYLYGIPARNLDDDDWAQLDADQQAEVEASSLYVMEP